MVWFLILGLLEILAVIYFMSEQTYVIYLELDLGIIACIFLGLEFIIGLLMMFVFKS